jgi:quercetin dioxygenase-like cupin family protein
MSLQSPDARASRRTVLRGLGASTLALTVLAQAQRRHTTAAQEATPAPLTGPTGVTANLMGIGEPQTAPGFELSLRRVTIVPGGGIPAHSHPGSLVIFVEAGTWGYVYLGGIAQLTRAGTDVASGVGEAMTVGEEVTLTSGDWLFVEDPQDDIRNAGENDVVLLIAGLTRVGEPFTTLMEDMDHTEMEGTPTG